jgi:carbon storage regulator
MLVLSRRLNETIRIGADIRVTVLAVKGGKVQLGLEAPREVPILRAELRTGGSRPTSDVLSDDKTDEVTR